MSSSKRGRKRNENLPPNRARDVQRAFRARRAAHLQALEERVEVLEDENARLREALGMPPADRPVLGRGPTGKDKIKPFISTSREQTLPSSPSEQLSSGTSSSPGSPATVRSTTTPQSAGSGFDSLQWGAEGGGTSLVIHDHFDSPSPSPLMPDQQPYKHLPSYALAHGLPHPLTGQSQTPALPNLYIPPQMQHQLHSPSPGADYYSMGDQLQEESGSSYSYSQQQQQQQRQTPQLIHPRHQQSSQSHHKQYPPDRQEDFYSDVPSISSNSYGHRRAITEPYNIRPLQAHPLSFLGQHHNSHHQQPATTIRLPSPPRLSAELRSHGAQGIQTLVE